MNGSQVRSDKPGRSNNASIGQGVYIYNHAPRSPPAWTITGNSFVIEGPYAGNLNTQISWFFAMESSRARTIVIRGKHDTEKEADFLFCGYKNGSDEPILFNPWGWSGSGTINLSQKIQNVEKEFEVFCRFASDESVSGNGIEITSVVIR